MADASYQSKVYIKQDGDELVIASGGSIDIESGGAFKIGGTAVTATAAEINELDLSAVGAVSKIKKINMTASSFSDNSEVGTGWSLPDNAVVKNVFIRVNTAEQTATTKTIDVGTDSTNGGDADGYLVGVSVASTGLVKGTLDSAGQTLGALLYVDEDGSGALVSEIDIASGGKEITVTAGDASGFSEVDFDIFIEYIEIA